MRPARLLRVIFAAPVVSGAASGGDDGAPNSAGAAPAPTQSATFAVKP